MKIVFFMIILGGICYYWGKSNGLADHCNHDWQMGPQNFMDERQQQRGIIRWTCVKCHRTRFGI
jgi:hypothetical protein